MCRQDNRSNKPIRLLIVDDSPHILRTLTSFFRQHPGFELVGTVVNGRHALRHAESLKPDLVLMDVRLPGMSGLEATRRIKARNDNPVAVIIMTTDDHPGIRAAAKAAGADGFVGKAADMSTALQSTIRKLFPSAPRRIPRLCDES